MASTISIEEYLKGCVAFSVSDTIIKTVLVKRTVVDGVLISSLDEKTKDLCEAEMLYILSTMPSTSGTISDADNGWKHSEGGSTISQSDKRYFRSRANKLRVLHGELPYTNSGIRVRSFSDLGIIQK